MIALSILDNVEAAHGGGDLDGVLAIVRSISLVVDVVLLVGIIPISRSSSQPVLVVTVLFFLPRAVSSSS